MGERFSPDNEAWTIARELLTARAGLTEVPGNESRAIWAGTVLRAMETPETCAGVLDHLCLIVLAANEARASGADNALAELFALIESGRPR